MVTTELATHGYAGLSTAQRVLLLTWLTDEIAALPSTRFELEKADTECLRQEEEGNIFDEDEDDMSEEQKIVMAERALVGEKSLRWAPVGAGVSGALYWALPGDDRLFREAPGEIRDSEEKESKDSDGPKEGAGDEQDVVEVQPDGPVLSSPPSTGWEVAGPMDGSALPAEEVSDELALALKERGSAIATSLTYTAPISATREAGWRAKLPPPQRAARVLMLELASSLGFVMGRGWEGRVEWEQNVRDVRGAGVAALGELLRQLEEAIVMNVQVQHQGWKRTKEFRQIPRPWVHYRAEWRHTVQAAKGYPSLLHCAHELKQGMLPICSVDEVSWRKGAQLLNEKRVLYPRVGDVVIYSGRMHDLARQTAKLNKIGLQQEKLASWLDGEYECEVEAVDYYPEGKHARAPFCAVSLKVLREVTLPKAAIGALKNTAIQLGGAPEKALAQGKRRNSASEALAERPRRAAASKVGRAVCIYA